MKTVTLDNSADTDLTKAITWQYDNAENLVNLIMMLKMFFKKSTENFWNGLMTKLNIAVQVHPNIDAWGLAVWGKLLGIPRLSYGVSYSAISLDLYRRILVAVFRLRNSNASFDAYVSFCNTAFNGHCTVTDGYNMGITFTATADATAEEEFIIENFMDRIVTYPVGVKSAAHSTSPILGFDGQAPVSGTDDPPIDTLNNAGFNYRITPKGNWTL